MRSRFPWEAAVDPKSCVTLPVENELVCARAAGALVQCFSQATTEIRTKLYCSRPFPSVWKVLKPLESQCHRDLSIDAAHPRPAAVVLPFERPVPV